MFLFRVVDALQAAKVPHAIAGGYAVALHGAVRGTIDIDLVLRLRQADFEAAERVFAGLGLAPRLPVKAAEVFSFREEYIRNRNLLAWSFSNPANPAEIVDVLIAENLADCRVLRLRVQGRTLPVVSIEDLIRMKSGTGRLQDREDVAALERLRESG